MVEDYCNIHTVLQIKFTLTFYW